MIGETFYLHDHNRRRYTNEDGTERGSPDPRYMFFPVVIMGETRDSWTFERYGRVGRINKKTLRVTGPAVGSPGFSSQAYTAEGMEDALWDQEHRRAIIRIVEQANTKTLKQIAKLLDYGQAD